MKSRNRIKLVHPLRPLLDIFLEIERRMVKGSKFSFCYSDVSNSILFLSRIVEGVLTERDKELDRVTEQRAQLRVAIESLLGCCELNLDDMEDSTHDTLDAVRNLIKGVPA